MSVLRIRPALQSEMAEARAWDLEESVGTMEGARFLDALGQESGKKVRVHICVDVGMGRTGFKSEQIEEMREVLRMPGLEVVGVYAHMPNADMEDQLDHTSAQLDMFDGVVAALGDALPKGCITHVMNTSSMMRLKERVNKYSMARAGSYVWCYVV